MKRYPRSTPGKVSPDEDSADALNKLNGASCIRNGPNSNDLTVCSFSEDIGVVGESFSNWANCFLR